MGITTVKIKDVRAAEAFCIKHIGRRLFYTHVAQGGQGWIIKKTAEGNVLSIEGKQTLFTILALSDIIDETQRR